MIVEESASGSSIEASEVIVLPAGGFGGPGAGGGAFGGCSNPGSGDGATSEEGRVTGGAGRHRSAVVKGRVWLLIGVAVGVAAGIGKLPYLAGAASTLSDTAQRIVSSAGLALIHGAARRGVSRRIVEGLAGAVGLLVPGVTALLLIATARFTLRLRVLVGLLVLILGIMTFHYLGAGAATGTLLLALGAAGFAVVATGPLVATPLAALASLIGTEYLPKLVSHARSVPHATVTEVHRALFATGGSPLWLEIVLLIVAVVPFAVAARLVWR